jgi:hypothetical protein
MRKVTYTTQVDDDVDYPHDEFATLVQVYLADPNGWEAHGYSFKVAKKNPHVTIHLTSPKNIVEVCGLPNDLSCAIIGGDAMYLNAARWMHGAPKSGQKLDGYRQYMVSHEMGHILGHEHAKCPGRGQPAPIMMQQTLGLKGCEPNTHVTKSDLKV